MTDAQRESLDAISVATFGAPADDAVVAAATEKVKAILPDAEVGDVTPEDLRAHGLRQLKVQEPTAPAWTYLVMNLGELVP